MDLSTKEIGNRIKTYRKKRHLKQKELAEILGCAEMTVSQWERGLYAPKADMRVKIANALNVGYPDLFMDMTPESFSGPEEFLKARYGTSEEKDGISWSSKTSYGDSIKNDTTFTFRQSGLSENEANELNNYYSYLMFKRNQAPTQDPEE